MDPGVVDRDATRMRRAASEASELPLAMSIREQADSGRPTVVAEPEGEVAGLYKALARKVAVAIAAKNKDFSSKFPSITISKAT